MVRGRWLPRTELDGMREQMAVRYAEQRVFNAELGEDDSSRLFGGARAVEPGEYIAIPGGYLASLAQQSVINLVASGARISLNSLPVIIIEDGDEYVGTLDLQAIESVIRAERLDEIGF